MGKQELLVNIIANMRSLADSLQVLANNMIEVQTKDVIEVITTAEVEKEVINKEKAKQKEIKLEDVRAVLAEKSRSGKTSEVKELIATFGADKLSEIGVDKYADLLKKAEVL